MFSIIKALLLLLSWLAKRAGDAKIEKGALDALAVLQSSRLRAADNARADVQSGRVPERPDDPYRRD